MTYGKNARVGNKVVFNRDGAIKAYATFCRMFNNDMSMEACSIVTKAATDMMSLGFTADELEAIEINNL